jgi:hypothetical protein
VKPPVRLKAETPEDIEVLAAHVQDAIVQVGDMAYLPKHRRFALSLNRFRWEEVDRTSGKPLLGWRYYRTNAGMHFDDVLSVQTNGVRQTAADVLLNLLDVKFEPGEEGAGTITLVFSAGAEIRLDVECIDAYLADRGTPWTTKNLPAHDGADSPETA